jgi:hypothetical protein
MREEQEEEEETLLLNCSVEEEVIAKKKKLHMASLLHVSVIFSRCHIIRQKISCAI